MKKLLLLIVLAALICSCSEPAAFQGPVRDLVPAQVGNFKIKGEVKSIPVAPEGQYKSGAIHPTENAVAQFETAGSSLVTLQITNYPSADVATKALRQLEQNIKSLANGAKFNESARGNTPAKKIVIEGIAPGYHAIVWTTTSVVFQVSGDNLEKVQEFEKSFP